MSIPTNRPWMCVVSTLLTCDLLSIRPPPCVQQFNRGCKIITSGGSHGLSVMVQQTACLQPSTLSAPRTKCIGMAMSHTS